ncbi:MAG TPA: hypothetical protein VKP88_02890 [Candidatus Paceibacterota bacterium]|nr:hypothetical protein [Candidatus Paceibacterota bacterium]
MFNTLKTIIPLALVCTVLVGYTYIDAQWVGPSTSPTGGNAPAPLNTGSDSQIKSGSLGVDALSVFGDAAVVDTTPGEGSWIMRADAGELHLYRTDAGGTIIGGDPAMRFHEHGSVLDDTVVEFDRNVKGQLLEANGGPIIIRDVSPELHFRETDQGYSDFKYKLMVNNDIFTVFADRNDDGVGDNSTVRFYAGATSSDDYAYFSNQVRADRYCDENGGNCTDAASMASGGGGGLTSCNLFAITQTSACTSGPPTPSCPSGYVRTSHVRTETCSGEHVQRSIVCTAVFCS